MALKYELEDNSTVDTLSLLTIRNQRMGHHHKQAGAGGQELAAQDRKGRLAEYHKMTNERRKQINAKVQKKRDKEQLEMDQQEKEVNKAKLDNAKLTPNGSRLRDKRDSALSGKVSKKNLTKEAVNKIISAKKGK